MPSLADARRMIDAAIAESERIGAKMNIAVVDAGGNLVAHVRMDGAFIGSIGVSIDKAWTSAAFKHATADLQEICVPGGPAYGLQLSNQGRVMTFGGGLPIRREGEVVGGGEVDRRRVRRVGFLRGQGRALEPLVGVVFLPFVPAIGLEDAAVDVGEGHVMLLVGGGRQRP